MPKLTLLFCFQSAVKTGINSTHLQYVCSNKQAHPQTLVWSILTDSTPLTCDHVEFSKTDNTYNWCRNRKLSQVLDFKPIRSGGWTPTAPPPTATHECVQVCCTTWLKLHKSHRIWDSLTNRNEGLCLMGGARNSPLHMVGQCAAKRRV